MAIRCEKSYWREDQALACVVGQVDVVLHRLGVVEIVDASLLRVQILSVLVVEQVDEGDALVARDDGEVFVLRVEEAFARQSHSVVVLRHLKGLGVVDVARSVGRQYRHQFAVGREGQVAQFRVERDRGAYSLVVEVDDLYLLLRTGYEEVAVGTGVESCSHAVDGKAVDLLRLACGKNVHPGVAAHHVQKPCVWRIADGRRLILFRCPHLADLPILFEQAVHHHRVLLLSAVDESIGTSGWVDVERGHLVGRLHEVVAHGEDFLPTVVVERTIVVGKSIWRLVQFHIHLMGAWRFRLFCLLRRKLERTTQ